MFLLIIQQEELNANEMALIRVGLHWNQNSIYWGKFQWNFDQGKGDLDRVSEEFELTEFELTV